ncbi:MAG: hypothetical protein JO190_04435 [Candidatus Eremiobacteraeota bacterium]|nr:hypothetical protein [Candidatus Eremiobacteraeota bacterium]
MNEAGEFSGGSEIPRTDPHLENFCGIPTGNPTHLCRPFHWQDGRMTQLPTLGGNNGMAFGVNSLPQVIGFAETGKRDSSCVAPQVFDFKGVIWQSDGTKVTLPPYPGDTVSLGFSINDEGQAVGSSGTCGPVFSAAPAVHALLWRHRKPVDLGNLGAPLASASHINNRGQVVGVSGLAGSGLFHAFLWQKGVMKDLGALPGGVFSNGTSINERGQVVGFSADASGNNTAFIWEDGTMKDLNRLVHASSLHLMIAADINDHGWITGDALDAKTGKIRGVLLIPIDDAASTREGF